ncbi:MAG: HIT domain-containing protein [Nanoarchaeota archaeon]|nr:HIT domain-containing protein [Nanoarchaeota archaeon]MCG2718941.1 HIT domain-containing protein [Nanoarchaeota archaeon]
MKDCLFCQFIAKEKECPIIYEDDNIFVMLDVRPATTSGGHCLVIPKKHYHLITDVPDDELIHVGKGIKMMTKALLKEADGVNVLQNNMHCAGQAEPHVHFHIIPRYKDDDIQIEVWEERHYKDGEDIKVIKRIQKLLKE